MVKILVKEEFDITCVNKRTVSRIRAIMPMDSDMDEISSVFSALGSRTGAKIVYALSLQRRLCVHEIAKILGISVSAVSHQLRKLRDRKVVAKKNEGNVVYYSLNRKYIRGLLIGAFTQRQ